MVVFWRRRREARKARFVEEAVDAKVKRVVVTPCRAARRLASSASGIRWPIPGVASIATCGGLLFSILLLAVACLATVGVVGASCWRSMEGYVVHAASDFIGEWCLFDVAMVRQTWGG